jgi:hypothetical protein
MEELTVRQAICRAYSPIRKGPARPAMRQATSRGRDVMEALRVLTQEEIELVAGGDGKVEMKKPEYKPHHHIHHIHEKKPEKKPEKKLYFY